METNRIAEMYRGIEITNCTGFATGAFSVSLINCHATPTIESARRAIDAAHKEAKAAGRNLAQDDR